MDDLTLATDYHFLEDVLRSVESGKRLIQNVVADGAMSSSTHQANNGNNNTNHSDHNKRQRRQDQTPAPALLPLEQQQSIKLNGKQKHFVQRAASKGVTVLIQPSVLQRHKQNKSYSTREGGLFWTVEWRIHRHRHHHDDGDDKQSSLVVDTQLTLVKDDVELMEAWKQCALSSSTDVSLESHHMLLKRIPCPANQPLYIKLSQSSTLETWLRDMSVIEFPTIEMVPSARLDDFPLLVQEEAEETRV